MSGYNSVPKFIPCQVAIRQALGGLGYGDSYQTMQPDLIAWVADAMDLISRLKTYTDLPCGNYTTCNNKIELPLEMALITCVTVNGKPMTYLPTKGCNKVTNNSPNRCDCGAQGFYIDECYMHFTPAIADGVEINVGGLGRPMDVDGFPLIPEVAILAISEYVSARICLRFRDSRYNEFQRLWEKHCLRARAELNQMSNEQVRELGYRYLAVPYSANYGDGYALGVSNLNG